MIMKRLVASAVVLLLVGWGNAPAVADSVCFIMDHYWNEIDTLGTKTTDTDVFKLVCPSGTSHVYADVVDLSGYNPDTDIYTKDGILFTLLLVKSTTGITVLKHVPDAGESSSAVHNGGAGTYYLQIHKNQKAVSTPVDYAFNACCVTSSGGSRSISVTQIQNR